MKIKIRPLKGDIFDVEVEADEKVEDLKKRIAQLNAEFQAEHQKLIFAGKVLVDTSKVSEYGIGNKPTDFLVLMVSKPKQAVAKAPSEAPAPAAADTASTPSAGTTAPAATPYAPGSAPAEPVNANEGQIVQLCDMGFPREEVERCLRAAFNDASRAVEYLTTGIPTNMRERSRSPGRGHGHGHAHAHEAHGHSGHGHDCDDECSGHGHDQSAHGHDGHAAHGHSGHDAGHGGHGGGHDCGGECDGHGDEAHGPGQGHGHSHSHGPDIPENLLAIRENPRYQELRVAVLENPAVLPMMLQALQQAAPELHQAISSNQEAFLEMLQMNDEDDDDDDDDHGNGHAHGHGHGHDDDGHGHGGQITVTLSEDERGAIERLTGLGFSQEQVLEAYLACDKKEELAANFLFDNME